jgi:hypothetical protein
VEPAGFGAEAAGKISEAQRILDGLLAELPEDAKTLVEKVNQEIAKAQEQTEERIARIREQAESEVAIVESKVEERRRTLLGHAVEQLEPLQKDLFRSGDLAKALATFIQIQTLKAKADNILPDPGNLLRFREVGKSFQFRVVGNDQGPVWGTDIYTADSHLAAAAVHAGALETGEEGVVRVSLVDMTRVPVRGSMQNGVMTMDWGPYPVGYRVARA